MTTLSLSFSPSDCKNFRGRNLRRYLGREAWGVVSSIYSTPCDLKCRHGCRRPWVIKYNLRRIFPDFLLKAQKVFQCETADSVRVEPTLQKIPFCNLQNREIYTICTGFLHVWTGKKNSLVHPGNILKILFSSLGVEIYLKKSLISWKYPGNQRTLKNTARCLWIWIFFFFLS